MKVDIWAEVTCPWCGLGNHRLATAIERFEHADEVELVHHSFPLSSSFPEGDTFSVREAWDAIFATYFGRAEPVFSSDDLLGLSDELGLDREQTRQVLTDRRYRRQVRDDAARAQRLGATGAPFIVVDDRYGLPGAQDSDNLLELLRTAWDDSHPRTHAGDAPAPVCGPDGCAVPEHA